MEAEAANARRVDWVQARADVIAAAGAAQSIPDTYPAIAIALNRLTISKATTADPTDA